MRRTHRSAIFAGALAAGAALGACSSGPDPGFEGLASGVSAAADAGRATPATLYPFVGTGDPVERRFAGAGGAALTRTVEPDGSGRSWTIAWAEGDAGEPAESLVLRLEPDGSLVSTRTVNPDRGVFSEFDPPMLVMPPELEPGARAERPFRMVVRPIDDPGAVTERGGGRSIVGVAGTRDVVWNGEPATAWLVRWSFEATLGPAQVRNRTERLLIPGVGVVAESTRRLVRVLGVQTESRSERRRAEGLSGDGLAGAG